MIGQPQMRIITVRSLGDAEGLEALSEASEEDERLAVLWLDDDRRDVIDSSPGVARSGSDECLRRLRDEDLETLEDCNAVS